MAPFEQCAHQDELSYAEEDEEDADDHPDVEQRDVGDLAGIASEDLHLFPEDQDQLVDLDLDNMIFDLRSKLVIFQCSGLGHVLADGAEHGGQREHRRHAHANPTCGGNRSDYDDTLVELVH